MPSECLDSLLILLLTNGFGRLKPTRGYCYRGLCGLCKYIVLFSPRGKWSNLANIFQRGWKLTRACPTDGTLLVKFYQLVGFVKIRILPGLHHPSWKCGGHFTQRQSYVGCHLDDDPKTHQQHHRKTHATNPSAHPYPQHPWDCIYLPSNLP